MRYRKWTESYSYVTEVGDGVEQIIAGLIKDIIRAPKRQRVYAKADEKKLILTAMKYDDDESNRTENVYMKGRFDANMYWMNPAAPGWASNNKYDLGAVFSKEGTQHTLLQLSLFVIANVHHLTTRVFCIVAAGTILSQLWLQISIINTMVLQSSLRTSIEQLMICGAEQSRLLRFTHLIMVKSLQLVL